MNVNTKSNTAQSMTLTTADSVTLGSSQSAVIQAVNSVQHDLQSLRMSNPNPTCDKDCRFAVGVSMSTAMYFQPVYDKHGNNLNPDGNTTTSTVSCGVCGKSWVSRTRLGETTFQEVT